MTIHVQIKFIPNFIFWYFKIFNSLGKKILRQFPTSALSETIFSFSVKTVFSRYFVFSEKKGC